MTRDALDLRDESLLHELIGRSSRVSREPLRPFTGETVLVTGAGGSVGAELARQIGRLAPTQLVLLDHSEYALFRIEQELREEQPDLDIRPVLADVTRPSVLRDVFAHHRPQAVFHAAAYKHVAMLERDVLSAVRANVLGTLNVAGASRRVNARLLLISSDKAANARSVMGASKRLAEMAVLSPVGPGPTAAVRFGNVAGSSGSVLEIMLDRARRGLPLLVTDQAATRYFMTASEAVSLVLRADRLRARGNVFWLDMGEPVRIVDLATRLAARTARAGLPPVPIEFIGLRPGEKLREELTVQGLELVRTECDGIWIARQGEVDEGRLRRALAVMRDALRSGDAAAALAALEDAVPEYESSLAARSAAHAQCGAACRQPVARVRTAGRGRVSVAPHA